MFVDIINYHATIFILIIDYIVYNKIVEHSNQVAHFPCEIYIYTIMLTTSGFFLTTTISIYSIIQNIDSHADFW